MWKAVGILLVASMLSANAQTMNYVKMIRRSDGSPKSGLISLSFRFVDKSGKPIQGWSQTTKVYTADGVVSVTLGDNSQGSVGTFRIEQLEHNAIEVVDGNEVIDRVSLQGEVDLVRAKDAEALQGSKILVSDIDQAGATNNQVLTWVASEQSWRPRASQSTGSGGTTGVNTLNGIKGDMTLESVPPVTISTSSGKVSIALAPNAIPQNTGVPIGTVVAFYGSSNRIPEGWLLCDGKPFNRATFPALADVLDAVGASPTNAPDLRGQFLRGANLDRDPATGDSDWSRRVGIGDKIGSWQSDELRKHKHVWPYYWWGAGPSNGMVYPSMISHGQPDNAPKNPDATTAPEFGGSETRPKNVAIHWIIRAR